MRVFIYSRQHEIAQIICDHLISKGNLCFAFASPSELSMAVRNQKKLPDLLILDYTIYNHDIFNLYSYMDEVNLKFPVIFYNDPCLIRSNRADHWKAILELTQTKYLTKDFSNYEPVLKALAELIDSEELFPYITLLQPAKPVPLSFVKDLYTLQYLKENKDDCIYQFQERNHIPKNIFYLLQLLQKNKEISLTLKDLADFYKKDGKDITIESLRVIMSRLRNYIRNDKDCNFLIYHDQDRFKFVRFKV